MKASWKFKPLMVAAALALGTSGCAYLPEFRPGDEVIVALPVTAADIPEIAWRTVPTVHWLLADYAISPNFPTFQSGTAYRLIIRNTGEKTHVLDAPDFYDALAIKSVETSAFRGHTGDDHVDEPIGPKGQDGVPKLPEIAGITMDSDDSDGDSDSANPFASDSGDEGAADDPFAADSGDEGAADDPFAAKPGEDADASGAANPFAEKPAEGDEAAAEDSQTADADSADETKPADDDSAMEAEKPADDEPAAEDSQTADADSADETKPADDDSAMDADKPADDEPAAEDKDEAVAADAGTEDTGAESQPDAAAWEPLQVTEIAIEPGHETTVEFVAVRPGSYGLSSADWIPTILGMFTLAIIEAPAAEAETAAAD